MRTIFVFFPGCKASLRRLLILLPVLFPLIGQAQNGDLPVDADAEAWKNIKATIRLIRQDRIASLATQVAYPLRRENPLPDL